MYAKAIEIAWHEDSSIWSLHLSCANRLVTAGGDKVARVWKLHPQPHIFFNSANNIIQPSPSATSQPLVDWLCDLRAHTTTVNVARFTQDGYTIATGADQGEIVLWTLEEQRGDALSGLMENGKERWIRSATLRAHVQDVLDLAWSRDGTKLVSASVDNAIMIWDVKNPTKSPVTLRNHANFVQGISIDPFSRLIASLGNDRTMRVFTSNATNWYQVAYLSNVHDRKLFMDDARFKNCFRRLGWSPDGSVVACPSGVHLPVTKRQFAVHIFARNQWLQPTAQCGGLTKPAVAVRFSPILYELRYFPHPSSESEGSGSTYPFAKFTYRMIFAVLCVDRVLFYDTQNFQRPFASVKGIHVAENTDLTWSSDGHTVAVSSADGYVGLICFTTQELGQKLSMQNTPPWLHRREDMVPAMQSPSKSAHATKVTVVQAQPSRALDKISRKSTDSSNSCGPPSTGSASNDIEIVAHPKAGVPTVHQPQSHQAHTAIATKSTTSGQGYRIALTRPTDTAQPRSNIFKENGVVDLTQTEHQEPPIEKHREKATMKSHQDIPNPKAQPFKSSTTKTFEPIHPPVPLTSKSLARDVEVNDIPNVRNPLTKASVGDEKSAIEKPSLRPTGVLKEGVVALEGKTVGKCVVANGIDKEESAEPQSPVKHNSSIRDKPSQRASPSQICKRRLKTKQVQTTLLAFHNPASVPPKSRCTTEPAAKSNGSTSPGPSKKRLLADRPDQSYRPNSASDIDPSCFTGSSEQRKRRKPDPLAVCEMSTEK
ncbi:unnamed protein product [Agarophyton chilense]|eukprot:gb/GEZJ01005533.1/.p1 GENE.gb/GEZJ01005533.1/~~gb/GEZJ01005533.1/.p1  ORF type:complete len:768 (-),score=74.37 gb/GEZJ01005533.1/:2567-4870(-)